MTRSGSMVMGGLQQHSASFEASLRFAPQDEGRSRSAAPNTRHPEVRSEAKPRRTLGLGAALLLSVLLANPANTHPHSPMGDASASNRDHFIQLGEAVHGAFGPLIALGIRIGDDAMRELGAGPRQVDVTYFSGRTAPCPCVADGIMIVTVSSPGQGTLRVAAEPAGEGQYGRVLVKHRMSGRAVEYIIPLGVAELVKAGMAGGPEKRWSIMMDAPAAALFTRRMIEKTQ
jgi:FmdE, Molybdenum formylmethanofuran dehydrogenase operon